MLGFQAHKWSDSDEVLFTVNLLVVARETWERERAHKPYLGTKPNANIHPDTFAWWSALVS
jgi:hypothetical protein